MMNNPIPIPETIQQKLARLRAGIVVSKIGETPEVLKEV